MVGARLWLGIKMSSVTEVLYSCLQADLLSLAAWEVRLAEEEGLSRRHWALVALNAEAGPTFEAGFVASFVVTPVVKSMAFIVIVSFGAIAI